MSFFGIFGQKKEEQEASSQQNQPEPASANKPGAPGNAGGDASMFGGFAQVKTKPVASTSKPKGFDPFSMPAGNPFGVKPSSNNGSMTMDRGGNPPSGPGSLSRLDEGEATPGSNQEIVPEAPKKSAFGFIQKKPIKPAGSDMQPTSNLSFITNADTGKTEHQNFFHGNQNYISDIPDLDANTDARSTTNISERKQSLSSNASEPVNVGLSKGSAFGFLNKKKPNPPTDAESQQNMFNQSSTAIKKESSLNLDGSLQHDLEDSEARSDTGGMKIPVTPPNKSFGPSFMKFKQKSPLETESSRQTEETALPTLETKPDYTADRASEQGSSKSSSGPSFMNKFKKPMSTTKSQASETPQNESFHGSEQTPVSKNESPKETTSKFLGRFTKPQSEPEQISISQAKVIRTERVTSPLKPVQTPAAVEEENPINVRNRLESERSDIIESIGDLIVRQNGLMGKKNSLESQRANISKKLQMVAKQQNDAIEGDNFEEADHLEVVIVELNETMRDLGKQIDDCELEYANLEKEKQMLYQNQYLLYKNFVAELENIMLTQNYNSEKYKLECMNQQNIEKSYIEEKTKELQYNRNHIDLDLKHINEETHQIEETMDKQLRDHVTEQKDLSIRKTDLEMDIDRIRRELKAKEDELANVSKNLNKVNSKISTINSKFEDQLNKIKKKRDKVNSEEDKYQEDMSRLQQHQEKAEYSLKRLDEVMQNFSKTMMSYEELKTNFTQDSERLDQENNKREQAITIYYNSLNGLRQEKQELISCEEEIDKLKDDTNRFQKEIGGLTTQKNGLLNKIPELEKEKKAFVASRSFKDASRVSNDIKEVQTKVSELEERINQLSENEKLTLQKITTLEKETIPGLRKTVEVTLKGCDLHKYELLKVKENDLTGIHNYYLTQRQFEEANMIETELKTTQRDLAQLISQYPELQRREASHGANGEEIGIPQEEEHKESHENAEDIHQQHHTEEELLDNHHGAHDVEVHNEELKQLPLNELVAEYEDLQTKIKDLETLIEEYASEDRFDEADEATGQQEGFQRRQDEIMSDINKLGFSDINEAKEAVEKEGNEEKVDEEHDQHDQEEETNDVHKDKDEDEVEDKGEEKENEIQDNEVNLENDIVAPEEQGENENKDNLLD